MTAEQERRGAKKVDIESIREIIDGPGDPGYRLKLHAGASSYDLACALIEYVDLNEDKFRTIQAYCRAASEDKAEIASAQSFVKEMLIRCADAMNRIGMIDKLRANEGASVRILCDNPEGPPNAAVEVCDDWTGWEEKCFSGINCADALNAAIKARGVKS